MTTPARPTPAHLSNTPQVYAGPRFVVHAATLPGRAGAIIRRDAVVTPDSVVVLPLLDDDTVVLIRNRRFVVGKTLWELCAGTLEPGEDPLPCAARELIEETGYRSDHLEPLTSFHPTPGLATEYMHAFLATRLTHVGQDLDENEQITVEAMKLSKALDLIADHSIEDGKTIAALLFYMQFRRPRK